MRLLILLAALFTQGALAQNTLTHGTAVLFRGSTNLGTFPTHADCVASAQSRTISATTAYQCRENLSVAPPAPPPASPTVTLSANPSIVTVGSASTLQWSSAGTTDCTASGGWNGSRPTSGSESTGPLDVATAYTLTCNGPGGTANASVTVNTQAAPPPGSQFGLEWPGNGASRRMLLWANPHTNGLPAYPATYLFRLLPKGPKTTQFNYWTTFFWGNNGDFSWGANSCRSFYGAHPYPFNGDASTLGQNWEIAIDCGDVSFVTPNGTRSVDWNRWHTQAMRVWKDGNTWRHEFYFDLPDTSKVITYNSTQSRVNPPHPALVMGQAPDIGGVSWGLYPGWEEFKGVIRGIQVYSAKLEITDILNELVTPQSSALGNSSIWYLNLDPRPSDVTDKKVGGTPHNPSWSGGMALEWAQ